MKGLDLVRRDWCQLSKDMQSTILDQLLSGKGKDELADFIHNYLRTKAEELTRGTIGKKKKKSQKHKYLIPFYKTNRNFKVYHYKGIVKTTRAISRQEKSTSC